MKNNFITALLTTGIVVAAMPVAARHIVDLKEGWQFAKDTVTSDTQWERVTVPHDWAIYGPFSRDNDLQVVAVEQNGETEKTVKTGRTGGLPYYGKGFYKTTMEIPDTAGRSFVLVFDGAMSNPVVRVNGNEVGRWAYGYNAFVVPLDGAVRPGSNTLEVDLFNKPQSSRWYPGAGIYRNVHLVETSKIHIPVWGTCLTTPHVNKESATVHIETDIEGAVKGQVLKITTDITDPHGHVVASNVSEYVAHGQKFAENILVKKPDLWSPETPVLYTARTRLFADGKEVDSYDTRFGIRTIEYRPDEGFFLNGRPTKFRGVCNHHDLGPLGAAVNESALRHQLELLKEMGVNAIRTSHNVAAPELVRLCDEMGLMMMVESFDDWGFRPKSLNGYGSIFNEWAERDMVNMVRQFRNNPSVVMWSIGNEVPSQWGPDGISELTFLQDIVHREDPTRPVTCGMDQIGAVLDNGFAAALDIPGFNYKPQYYEKAYDKLPQRIVLGSETASTVSSRGVYHFPVEIKSNAMDPDHQSSSYDTDVCYWSNIPDIDFAADDDYPWMIGQFVWTGFDYLGEPTPYDTDAWPNHSSVFGIIDLASIPKDRFYLYRSKWNTESPTLHVLPHWTWPGRDGKATPVMVYTSYPAAELYVNGKSQGRREKTDTAFVMERYRLIWDDVVYEPGEIKVIAFDEAGKPSAETVVRTAGKPHHLILTSNRDTLVANGDDLAYVTVQVVDKNGNIVPTDNRHVRFAVEGAGAFRATANGDPTCLLPFQNPEMDLFSGAATAIVSSGKTPGRLRLKASAPGVKSATIDINVN